jgi:integrase
MRARTYRPFPSSSQSCERHKIWDGSGSRSGALTDKDITTEATDVDQWLTEFAPRGTGRFMCRISRGGERSFYFRYTTSNGDRDTLRIGAYHPKGINGYSLAQARARAMEWRRLCSTGVRDLRDHLENLASAAKDAEARATRVAAETDDAAILERQRRLTLRALFERWRTGSLQPRLRADGKRIRRKDGGQYTADQFERYVLPKLGNQFSTEVRKADLMAILDNVRAAGKLRTCNVLLADLKQMFSFALVREIVDRNPLDLVTKNDAGGSDALRERVLTIEEITALPRLLSTARINPRTEAAIWLILATGARVGELTEAVWNDEGLSLDELAVLPEVASVKLGVVDAVNRRWYLPTTKNEREHTIHLSDFALRQIAKIEALREARITDDGQEVIVPWLFPNSAATGPVNVKSFGKQLADRQRPPERRLKGRSKQTDSLRLSGGRWTAHDLRRTTGKLMASIGISGDVIDECLNHVIESRVRRTYIRDRRPLEQANAFDALGSRLAQIAAAKSAVERA